MYRRKNETKRMLAQAISRKCSNGESIPNEKFRALAEMFGLTVEELIDEINRVGPLY